MVNLLRIKIRKKLQKNFGQKFFLHFGLFFGGFEISKPIFFVIFGFPSKKKFFSHRNVLLSSEINFEVNMISRSQKNEKSSPPPPQREPLRGGGLPVNIGFSRANKCFNYLRSKHNSLK